MPAAPPPPPPQHEQRQFPRVEVFASVELKTAVDILILPLKNISLGGAYVLADGADLKPHFPVASVHELMIFDAEDETMPTVRVSAEVLRHERDGGLALKWTKNANMLSVLISRLRRR